MEVKVTKCENGHYYDVNKYNACPHCGAGEFSMTQSQKKRRGLFKKNAIAPAATTPVSIQFSKEIPSSSGELVFEDVETAGIYMSEQLQVEDVKTAGVYAIEQPQVEDIQTQGVFTTSETEETVTNGAYLTQNPDTVEDNDLTAGFFAVRPEFEMQTEQNKATGRDDEKTTGYFAVSAQTQVQIPSLQDQIRAVTDDNNVKTTGLFAANTTSDTAENCQISTPAELPVGWLVCITGKNLGKDYRIVVGKNSIGRTQDNAIWLTGEASVSRDNHAWVIFEPRKQEFYIKPGDGSGLVYLNGENTFDTTMLHSGDIIELGDVKLIFVALCGESFNWSNYIGKE